MAVRMKLRTAANKLLKLFGADGEHWTRGYEALDKTDEEVKVTSRKAVKWCLNGAMNKLRIPAATRNDFRDALGTDVIDFNDRHKTYTHVRRFLEKVAKSK